MQESADLLKETAVAIHMSLNMQTVAYGLHLHSSELSGGWLKGS